MLYRTPPEELPQEPYRRSVKHLFYNDRELIVFLSVVTVCFTIALMAPYFNNR